MNNSGILDAAVAVSFLALSGMNVGCLAVYCHYYNRNGDSVTRWCTGVTAVQAVYWVGVIIWSLLLFNSHLFIYHLAFWDAVDVAYAAATTDEFMCCATTACGCTAPALAGTGADCAAQLAGLRSGVSCVDLEHCCAYDLASCDCGTSVLGQNSSCMFRTCTTRCAACFRTTLTLQISSPTTGLMMHLNKSRECTSQTEPNAGCLDDLLAQWPPGSFWNQRGTDVLMHVDWFAADIVMAAMSVLMVVSTMVQVVLCVIAARTFRRGEEKFARNAADHAATDAQAIAERRTGGSILSPPNPPLHVAVTTPPEIPTEETPQMSLQAHA